MLKKTMLLIRVLIHLMSAFNICGDVVEVPAKDFERKVQGSPSVWIVFIFLKGQELRPWEHAVHEFTYAAKVLKDIVNFGNVTVDVNDEVGSLYYKYPFPMINIYGYSKSDPKIDVLADLYYGRLASGLYQMAFQELREMVALRKGMKKGTVIKDDINVHKQEYDKTSVHILADTNIEQFVRRNDTDVVVNFYTRHSRLSAALAPKWASAGSQFKRSSRVKVAAIDVGKYKEVPAKFGIRGVPSIIHFSAKTKIQTEFTGKPNLLFNWISLMADIKKTRA